MPRTRKVLWAFGLVLGVGIAALAYTLQRTEPCAPPSASATQEPSADAGRAVQRRCYGGPEVLELATLPRPTPEADQVLVRVQVAALNPLDWHGMRGEPYFMRLGTGLGAPAEARMGSDFAGTIVAVGAAVTRFAPGDEVFGVRTGALADYVLVRESGAIAKRPANVPTEQAAGAGVAALTALQALRDSAALQPGQRVLVNGASGGVGTFAVQIAKSMGAEVTGVTSTRNVALVRSLGADRVVDYTREDFAAEAARYDVIVDTVGNRELGDLRHALAGEGIVVGIGGPKSNRWFGPVGRLLRSMAYSPFGNGRFVGMLAESTATDLEELARLMAQGRVRTVVDRRYPLEGVGEAMRLIESGRTRGKVIVDVTPSAAPR